MSVEPPRQLWAVLPVSRFSKKEKKEGGGGSIVFTYAQIARWEQLQNKLLEPLAGGSDICPAHAMSKQAITGLALT